MYVEQTNNRTHSAEKNGLWEGRYIYKKERRSIYCKTQEEVSRQLDEIIASTEKRELHSSKSAYAVFLADGMATFLRQADPTAINIYKL